MNELFFELIRVAIGTQESLSRMPSEFEWKALYDMAKKQSLVGICFAGVQNMCDSDEEFYYGMSEMQYLVWMGMAAKIQQKNQIVDEHCVALQKRLSVEGLRSSILKGQGVGQLYTEHLRGLRQSGDIDVYVDCGMDKTLAYVREKFGNVEYDYINAHVHCFEDTEVELHWRAQALTNVFANRRLQKWLEEHQNEFFSGKTRLEVKGEMLEIVTPSVEFNSFYILLHCYHHMFESGLGLRQLMDYYFVLKELDKKNSKSSLAANGFEETSFAKNIKNIDGILEEFGMKRFASGVMWIMKEVFGLSEEMMLCEANEKEGKFLLVEVMQNGNFGHYDERIKKLGNSKMSFLWQSVQHNLHLASHYPSEFLWAPIWLVYHYFWKRTYKT